MWCNLGGVYGSLGRVRDAADCFRRALALAPGFALAHYNLGNALHALGEVELAIASFRTAATIDARAPDIHVNLGNALKDAGRIDEAVTSYRRALAIDPRTANAHNNLGQLFESQGKHEEAAASYRQALQLQPALSSAAIGLGNILRRQGRLTEAQSAYHRALTGDFRSVDAHNGLGLTFLDLGNAREAANSFRRALEIDGGRAGIHNNFANALKELNDLEGAVAAYRLALALDATYASAYRNLAQALIALGRLKDAIAAFECALELDPDDDVAAAELLHACLNGCAWDGLAHLAATVDRLTDAVLAQGGMPGETPFMNISRCDDPARNLRIAAARSRDIGQRALVRASRLPAPARKAESGKITLGYLSSDFQDHAIGHLMRNVFGLHDRRAFGVHAYSHGPDDASDCRKQIQQDCDRFDLVRERSDAEIARLIHDQGVDILIDLNGWTRGARLGIAALRPAPVIATYLGYPGTTGASFIDYAIVDRIVAPEEHESFFSEKLVYLPHSYQANDYRQAISEKVFMRADFGLPDDGFVFCSFNQPYKIDPLMFGVWMELLRDEQGSVLWLLALNDVADDNLRSEAARRGVEPERLVFSDKLPKDRHLARARLADLMLDTRMYGGHTTTSDALWAGVPVVTMLGNHFASRVCSSLLKSIGLPELVTGTLGEYKALALKLARDPAQLRMMRQAVEANRRTAPLFDTPRFVQNLETAYRMIWEHYRAGHGPSVITVVEGT